MRKIIPILLITLMVAGCDGTFRARPFQSSVCGGQVAGYTATIIAYADSKLVVIPLSKIRVDTEWRFVLVPKVLGSSPGGDDFKDNTVTITGKGPNDAWINTAGPGNGPITGSWDSAGDHTLTACVRNLPNSAAGAEYYYIVTVDEVGMLDPRADIEE